jgi:magnesium-transporting ATPase (P-type)
MGAMANKKKESSPKHTVLYYRTFIVTILLQILLVVILCNALYSWWPANEQNTNTVVGEVERIEMIEGRRTNPDYLAIVVNGQVYKYAHIRNEKSLEEIGQVIKTGDIVKITYKYRTVSFSRNAVVALQDQTQIYRNVESYNAKFKWILLISMLLCAIISTVIWLNWRAYKKPWYELSLLERICKRIKKDRKKKKRKEKSEQMNQKPTP